MRGVDEATKDTDAQQECMAKRGRRVRRVMRCGRKARRKDMCGDSGARRHGAARHEARQRFLPAGDDEALNAHAQCNSVTRRHTTCGAGARCASSGYRQCSAERQCAQQILRKASYEQNGEDMRQRVGRRRQACVCAGGYARRCDNAAAQQRAAARQDALRVTCNAASVCAMPRSTRRQRDAMLAAACRAAAARCRRCPPFDVISLPRRIRFLIFRVLRRQRHFLTILIRRLMPGFRYHRRLPAFTTLPF